MLTKAKQQAAPSVPTEKSHQTRQHAAVRLHGIEPPTADTALVRVNNYLQLPPKRKRDYEMDEQLREHIGKRPRQSFLGFVKQ